MQKHTPRKLILHTVLRSYGFLNHCWTHTSNTSKSLYCYSFTHIFYKNKKKTNMHNEMHKFITQGINTLSFMKGDPLIYYFSYSTFKFFS